MVIPKGIPQTQWNIGSIYSGPWIFQYLWKRKKIQKGSVETKSPSMFLGDHHFRNLFFKNLNFCKMSLMVKFSLFITSGKESQNSFTCQNWRFLKIWLKMKIFENLAKFEYFSNLGKIEDFLKFGKNWRYTQNSI